MENKDINVLLNSINAEFFAITPEEMENIKPDISPDPTIAEIKELLGELPSQIEYLQNKAIECKKSIAEFKLMVKHKKQVLERQKSEIRYNALKKHQEDQREFFRKFNERFSDTGSKEVSSETKKVKGSTLSKAALQELVKNLKPEKPTKNDLDDIANIETGEAQDIIVELESKLIELERYYDLLNTKVDKFENKFISARAHKGILVEEMRNDI